MLDRLEATLGKRKHHEIAADFRAAVAIIVSVDDPLASSVLLIQRTTRPNDPWSGQMAFPGGRVEPSDHSTLIASIREAREEIGLDLEENGHYLGAIDDIRAMAAGKQLGLVITPHVFRLEQKRGDLIFTLQDDEVESVLWAPVEAMRRGVHDSQHIITRPGLGTIKLPCYFVDGKLIWGLTFMMLRNLFTIIGGLERDEEERQDSDDT